jgi:hypothetical protein
MRAGDPFDEVLDSAIDAVIAGEPVEAVLARFPAHSAALRPELETAARALHDAGARRLPRSQALADNYTIVRAAVERAQLVERGAPAEHAPGPRAPWWQRRLTFASLTLPAGAFALLALASVSGAAAASIAATPGLRSAVVNFVASPHVPGLGPSDRDDDGVHAPSGADNGAAPSGGTGASGTRGDENRPTLVTLSGTIADLHGNVFTLKTADSDVKVNIDAGTKVQGDLADGATVTVTGDLTAEKNLHADSVEVNVTAAPVNPDATSTPRGNGGEKTPGPPSDKTTGPEPDHTPPGQFGDHTPGTPAEHVSPTAAANLPR